LNKEERGKRKEERGESKEEREKRNFAIKARAETACGLCRAGAKSSLRSRIKEPVLGVLAKLPKLAKLPNFPKLLQKPKKKNYAI